MNAEYPMSGLGEKDPDTEPVLEQRHLTEERLAWLFATTEPVEQVNTQRILHKLATCRDCYAACGDVLDMVRAGEMPRSFTWVQLLAARSRRQAPQLWQEIAPLAPKQRRRLLKEDERYASWGLGELLCDESRRAASRDPKEALALADDAVAVAQSLSQEATSLPCKDLKLLARAHRANALRTLERLTEANGQFQACRDGVARRRLAFPGYRAQILSLESSLQLDRRQLRAALHCLDEAEAYLEGGPGAGVPAGLALRLRLARANVLIEMDREAEALPELELAVAQAETEREELVARHNFTYLLARLGRFEDAARQLPLLARQGDRVGAPSDRPRLLWIRGVLAKAQGRPALAAEVFEAARRSFLGLEQGYGAAVVSLELAFLYFEQGRMAEVKQIAAELVAVFEAKDVHREALVALGLFRQAAAGEKLTAEFLANLLVYLQRAWGRPGLRFLPPEGHAS